MFVTLGHLISFYSAQVNHRNITQEFLDTYTSCTVCILLYQKLFISNVFVRPFDSWGGFCLERAWGSTLSKGLY